MAVRFGDAPGAHGMFRLRRPLVFGPARREHEALPAAVAASRNHQVTKGVSVIAPRLAAWWIDLNTRRLALTVVETRGVTSIASDRLDADFPAFAVGRVDTANRVNRDHCFRKGNPRYVYALEAAHQSSGLDLRALNVVIGDGRSASTDLVSNDPATAVAGEGELRLRPMATQAAGA